MNNKFDKQTKCVTQSVTRRPALKRFGIGVLAATGAVLLPTTSSKADFHPVSIAPILANAGVTAVLTPTSDPTVFTAIATGVVQTSLLGNCVENAQLTVRFPTTPGQPVILNGSGTFTSLDGTKSLQFTDTGTATPDAANPNFYNSKYQLTFTGGTGVFAGASGAADIKEVVMFTSPTTGTVTWTLAGLVITPR